MSPNSAASSLRKLIPAARACSCNKRSSTSSVQILYRSCFSTVNPLYSPNLTSGLTVLFCFDDPWFTFSVNSISIVGCYWEFQFSSTALSASGKKKDVASCTLPASSPYISILGGRLAETRFAFTDSFACG